MPDSEDKDRTSLHPADRSAAVVKRRGWLRATPGICATGRPAASSLGRLPAPRDYKKMYDRCSALARIGVWECDLATGALTWTEGVYDIFDLPHGTPVTRALIKTFYDEGSRHAMEAARSKAIAEAGRFTLDIRITTAKGVPKWVRLSADVECDEDVPVRIFGLKQDVTQEHDLLDRLRHIAERDALTGIANRSIFEAALARTDRPLAGDPPHAAIVLIDLDRFKQVNDTYGHAAGDECLRQTAARLVETFAPGSLVSRLGGDEFAVLLYAPYTPEAIERDIRRLVTDSPPSIVWQGRSLDISLSVGVATSAGWGQNATSAFAAADIALYAAKHAGRDTFRIATVPIDVTQSFEREIGLAASHRLPSFAMPGHARQPDPDPNDGLQRR